MFRARALFSVALALMPALSSVSMAAMAHASGSGGTFVVRCGSDAAMNVDLSGGPAPGCHCLACLAHPATALLAAHVTCATPCAAPLSRAAQDLALPTIRSTLQTTPPFKPRHPSNHATLQTTQARAPPSRI